MWLIFASLVLAISLSGCSSFKEKPQLMDSDKALAPISPELSAAYNQGLLLLQQDNKKDAYDHWQVVATQWPDYPGVWVNAALSQWQMKEYEAGLASSVKALEIQSDFCPGIKVQALMLRENGKFIESRDAYEKALLCDPSDANTPHNLGVLYDLYLHDIASALVYYKQAQALQTEENPTLAIWIADLQGRLGQMKSAENEQ